MPGLPLGHRPGVRARSGICVAGVYSASGRSHSIGVSVRRVGCTTPAGWRLRVVRDSQRFATTKSNRTRNRMTRLFSALYDNAILLLVLTTLFWGGNAIAGKFAVGHISPMLLTCGRWMIAAIILLAIAHRHLVRDWPVLKRWLPWLFVMGGVGFAGFNSLMYVALQFTTAINAGIIQAGIPMFIFILNFVVFRARPLRIQIMGYALTLVGVLIAATRGDLMALIELRFNIGDLIMIGAALAYSAYAVALGRKPALHWLSFLTVLVTSAAIAAVPFAAIEATTDYFVWPVTLTGWAVVAYTAIFPSILGQGFFIRGTELLGGNRAGMFVNLVPIHAALLAVLMLGEHFQLFHAIALVLVISGILLAQRFAVAKG